jgi:hypothetical protein
VFGPRRFTFAHIAIVVLSLVIALRARFLRQVFFLLAVRPLDSLDLNPYLVVDFVAT